MMTVMTMMTMMMMMIMMMMMMVLVMVMVMIMDHIYIYILKVYRHRQGCTEHVSTCCLNYTNMGQKLPTPNKKYKYTAKRPFFFVGALVSERLGI
jgi:hypothetical protein